MAVEVKPLFRPEAYRQKLNQFVLPGRVELARPKLVNWSNKLGSGKLDKRKETELLPDFLTDIFGTLLGYSGELSDMGDWYTMKREALVEVDGKKADAAFGRFGNDAASVCTHSLAVHFHLRVGNDAKLPRCSSSQKWRAKKNNHSN